MKFIAQLFPNKSLLPSKRYKRLRRLSTTRAVLLFRTAEIETNTVERDAFSTKRHRNTVLKRGNNDLTDFLSAHVFFFLSFGRALTLG